MRGHWGGASVDYATRDVTLFEIKIHTTLITEKKRLTFMEKKQFCERNISSLVIFLFTSQKCCNLGSLILGRSGVETAIFPPLGGVLEEH